MNATHISEMVATDTIYADQLFPFYLAFTTVRNNQAKTCFVGADDPTGYDFSSNDNLSSSMTVVHVRQKPIYMTQSSTSAISLDQCTWRNLLVRYEVLPSFVELLHSNNGGVLAYTSYTPGGDTADAFHVGYKLSDWCAI